MAALEDLKTTRASVRGVLPNGVVSVRWFGAEAVELACKAATGRVDLFA